MAQKNSIIKSLHNELRNTQNINNNDANNNKSSINEEQNNSSDNTETIKEQKGDEEVFGFSYLPTQKPKTQRSCWITYTSNEVHDILKTGFDRSPMFTGQIEGTGPRYCPSIEDKINRFAERDRHQLFVEPEGWNFAANIFGTHYRSK